MSLKTENLRIVVCTSGGGTNLQAIIDAMQRGDITGAEISCVISNNPNAYALKRAANNGIKSMCVSPKEFKTEFHKELLAAINSFNPDLIVLAGFMVTLTKELIYVYEGRIINIHPSLIPAFSGKGFYGLKVHEAALKRGVKVTGATVHFVTLGLDEGPIIMQKCVEVKEGDTPEILQRRVMEDAEWIIFPKVIGMIATGEISLPFGK